MKHILVFKMRSEENPSGNDPISICSIEFDDEPAAKNAWRQISSGMGEYYYGLVGIFAKSSKLVEGE